MVDKVEVVAEETTAEKPEVENQEATQTNETQSTQSKPEGLPEKFNSVEELAKSYSELEKKLGEQSQQRPSPAEPNPNTDNKSTLEVAENAVKDAGLNMETLQQEYSEKGELDTKSYEALEKVGITKQYVYNYIAGQQALAEQTATEIKDTVGGTEAYNDMVSWAANNMTDGERQAYNKAVNSSDKETVKLAVNALKAQYERANGVEPKLVEGKAAPTQEQGFKSWAQVTEAMADPRYAKDMAYQEEVKAKLENSNL
jgi:hypothetical protein